MAHDGDAGAHEEFDLGHHRGPALELDGVGQTLLHEAGRGREGLLGAGLVGAERQVGDDHGPLGRARHRPGQGHEVVDGHGHGGLEAVDVVAGAVTDEQIGRASCRERV